MDSGKSSFPVSFLNSRVGERVNRVASRNVSLFSGVISLGIRGVGGAWLGWIGWRGCIGLASGKDLGFMVRLRAEL
jgi:hypothetical protein